ncbi:hypothetical protein LCGC14_1313090 [marine sediment metagenome]|uniref:Disease resistance R13L4/SHOC-2-like LRR domain-containing protein n=1 Tax=marine sediment metagenome TaxID=412755 RepID=A0A0F9KLN0_9ZZZZ
MNEKNTLLFIINEFLTLKLESEKTHIYVAGQKFQQCSFLLIDIPVEDISSFDEIESIDAAAERLDHSLHPRIGQNQFVYEIPAKVEFWGHCSNLQVWAENGYNSKLLHMNLAFPLLRELARVGDPQANKIFKEEIIKRYNSGIDIVRKYLRRMDFLNYLSVKEFVSLIESEKERDALNQLRKMFPILEEPVIPVEKGGRNPLKLKIDIKNGKLSKLNLGGVRMKEVPRCLLKFSSLEDLNLSSYHLKKLPRWIGQLENLKMLKITKTRLKDLPDEVGNLQNLTRLNAQANQLEKLPDSIGKLKSLKILELSKNNIKLLPPSIGNLYNLEFLDLNENEITTFPLSFENLKNLKNLKLQKNRLINLPSSLAKLRNLRSLNLVHNKIKNLPEYIGDLYNLELLAMSHNPLVKIDKSIYDLPNLKDFWLLDVPIEEGLVEKSNFLSQWARIHYQKSKLSKGGFEKEDGKEGEAELIKYQKEIEANRRRLDVKELKEKNKLSKSLSVVNKLIEKEEYRIAKNKLDYIIRRAKHYHLNVIEQTAKKMLSKLN